MENFCSAFIEGCGFFGKYPDDEELKILKNYGINTIVDLTTESDELPIRSIEELSPIELIKFPIPDRRTPVDNAEFRNMLTLIIKHLNDDKKVYIHCRGGHGRSGLIVALLLRLLYCYDAETALSLTHQYHQKRKIIKPQFRKMGSPQTKSQKDFVRNFII